MGQQGSADSDLTAPSIVTVGSFIDDVFRADAALRPESEAVMMEVRAGNAVLSQFFQGRGWT
eukprot:462115-Amphidinium_carterae.1